MNEEALVMVDCFSVSGPIKGLCGSFQDDGGYEPLFIQLLDGTMPSYLGLNFKFRVMMEIKKGSSQG